MILLSFPLAFFSFCSALCSLCWVLLSFISAGKVSLLSFFKDFENAVGSETRCHSFYSLVTFFSVLLYSGQLLKII